MEIGAQFFTLRDYCKTKEDFAESLKKVADIGYKNVQISGVCDYEAEWLNEQLKQNGLKCVITHYNIERIKTQTQKVIDEHNIFGCDYIGIGCMPGDFNNLSDYDNFVKDYLPASQTIAQQGKMLMYHNHHMEFMKMPNGELFIENLAKVFEKNNLGFTLDTFWVQYGGADPALWIKKLSGRVPCIHLKDMAIVDKKQQMAPVGYGNINFDAVFKEAEKAGTKYMLVEQDDCYGENPFDCLKKSYEYLTAQGFK